MEVPGATEWWMEMWGLWKLLGTGYTWGGCVELMGVKQTLFCSLQAALRADTCFCSLPLPPGDSHCCLEVWKLLYPRHGQGTWMPVKEVLVMASESGAEQQ